MIGPIEFHKAIRNGRYTTNIKIYQSQQTLDYNGAPMFEIELTTTFRRTESSKTRELNPNDPYDRPYELELTLKQNHREIQDFLDVFEFCTSRWQSPRQTKVAVDKLKRVIQDFIDDCESYRGPEYNSHSEYSAYQTISGCYERLSLHFDKLREAYGADIIRIES